MSQTSFETAPIPLHLESSRLTQDKVDAQFASIIGAEFPDAFTDPSPIHQLESEHTDLVVEAIDHAKENGLSGAEALNEANDELNGIAGKIGKTVWKAAIEKTDAIDHRVAPVSEALANGESATIPLTANTLPMTEEQQESVAHGTGALNGYFKTIVRREKGDLERFDKNFGIKHTQSEIARNAEIQAELGEIQEHVTGTNKTLSTEKGQEHAAAEIALKELFEALNKGGRGITEKGREAIKSLAENDPGTFNELVGAYNTYKNTGTISSPNVGIGEKLLHSAAHN